MHMFRFLYIITFYFLLTTLTKEKEGALQNQANKIQTGQFQFSNHNSKSIELKYKLPLIKLKASENIKIALSLIFLQKFYLMSGIQFSIQPQVSSTSIEAVLTYNLTMQWKTVRVAYLMTNRIDIDCGYFSITNDRLNSAKEEDYNQTIIIESGNFTNRKPQYSSKKIKSIVWISGLKCEGSKFSVSFSSPIINTLSNPSFIFYTLKVFNKTSPIYMQLSYIVFQEQGKLNFKRRPSSNSFLQQNTETSQLDEFSMMTSFLGTDLQNLFQKSKGPIWEKFDVGGKQVISSDVLSQIRTIFQIVQCGINMREVLQLYLSPNLNFSDPKFKSFNKDKKNITYDECVLLKGQIFETKRMKQVCSICSNNETFDISCLKCVCKQGYTQVDKICYKNSQLCEQQNSIYQNEKCFVFLSSREICRLRNQVYNSITNRCQCDKNSTQKISPVDGKPYCMGKCPVGAVFNIISLSCQCIRNYQLHQNRCVKCGPMYEWFLQRGARKMCQCKQESHRTFPQRLCLKDSQDHKDYTQYVQLNYSSNDW